MAVRNNLFHYWKQKEIELGRTITPKEVADKTGLHRETVVNFLEKRTTRFDEPVIDKLCQFFNVPPGPVPFLIYEPDVQDN